MDGSVISARQTPASPFWEFSLRFYALKDVPPACLSLQDQSGVDVNCLLFALYAAATGWTLTASDMRRVIASVAAWKERLVVPLRGARRFLKEPPKGFEIEAARLLRDRIKAAELEAERLQQEALQAFFPITSLGSPAAPSEAARHNIAVCEQAFGATFDPLATAVLLAAFDKPGTIDT